MSNMPILPTDQKSCLPTRFAMAMAGSVDLYEEAPEFEEAFSQTDRLEVFQSMSVSGDYEECVAAAYFGLELSDNQQIALRAIHKLTTKWLVGQLTQNLIDRLDLLSSLSTKGRDVADITTKIMELMGMTPEGATPDKGGAKSRMILEHTGIKTKEQEQKSA
jgi:hypothetical protein